MKTENVGQEKKLGTEPQTILSTFISRLGKITEENHKSLSSIETKLREIYQRLPKAPANASDACVKEEINDKTGAIASYINTLELQSKWLFELHNHLSEIV